MCSNKSTSAFIPLRIVLTDDSKSNLAFSGMVVVPLKSHILANSSITQLKEEVEKGALLHVTLTQANSHSKVL